jgi:hypothetical protein
MDTMTTPKNPPLCKFGPGGDFISTWPDATETPETQTTEDRADVEERAWSRLMADLGLEAPLVSADPAGITFQHRAKRLKSTVRSLLEVLRRVRADAVGDQADQRLVDSQIALADVALEALPTDAPPARSARQTVLAAASARLDDVAMTADGNARVRSDAPYAVAKASQAKENTNDATDSDTETTGYSAVHPRLPRREWLFPDHAGDRRPSESDQGHRVRTRRSPRKKGTAPARRETQSPLFAGLA